MDRLVLAWSHLSPFFGAKPAASIRPRDTADYVAARRAAGMTNGTVNREVAVLKAAYRLGARLEMVDRAPVFPKKLPETNVREGFCEDADYARLAANADQLWLRCFVCLGFSYGGRKSEMLALRLRNVDLLDGWLTIETSKNGEGRRVALTQETKTLLAECIRGKEAHDFVLTRQDGSRVAQPRKD